MTTKLQNLINPHVTFSPNLLSIQMDRTLELQKTTSLRRTILMHEEIFKNQVKELHRLYNLQKKLMREVENETKRRKDVIEPTSTANFFGEFGARDDPREMSGSCSGESSRIPINFNLERASEKTKPFMNMVDEHKELKIVDEETDVEVELTLSIGRCTRNETPENPLSNKAGEFGYSKEVHEEEEECGERSSVVDDPRRHWLLKDLSLNKT